MTRNVRTYCQMIIHNYSDSLAFGWHHHENRSDYQFDRYLLPVGRADNGSVSKEVDYTEYGVNAVLKFDLEQFSVIQASNTCTCSSSKRSYKVSRRPLIGLKFSWILGWAIWCRHFKMRNRMHSSFMCTTAFIRMQDISTLWAPSLTAYFRLSFSYHIIGGLLNSCCLS